MVRRKKQTKIIRYWPYSRLLFFFWLELKSAPVEYVVKMSTVEESLNFVRENASKIERVCVCVCVCVRVRMCGHVIVHVAVCVCVWRVFV